MEKDIIEKLIREWGQELPELDITAMKIVGRILYLGKTLEKRAGKILSPYGIYYTDFDVLATLRRSGKPYALSPKELMNSVLITSGAMTALLNRLTKLDLIHRVPDSNDKRSTLACLSNKGKKLIDQAIVARFDEADDAIAMLNEKERDQLIRLLAKMTIHLKRDFSQEL